jgi:hypothetical protein
MRRPAPVPDPIPALDNFEGIINAKRRKDFGYGALATGRNVEVTDAKKLVRRNGYTMLDNGVYQGLYGSISQKQLVYVSGGSLWVATDPNFTTAPSPPLLLRTGLHDGTYSWDEDPANNVYYTSDSGSNGIVTFDNLWLPLSLAMPQILSVAVVDTAPWQVVPFNLGKKYTENAMQLFATYLYPDGRESAPSDIVTVSVAPEVKLMQMTVPVEPGCTTNVYATAPGGSTYYLVAVTDKPVFTFPVYMLTQMLTGAEYPYTTILSSFPAYATLVAFYAGRLWASCADAIGGLGVVYGSLPLQYHLFDFLGGSFQVSGRPLLLLPCKDGLIVGTDTNIYIYDPDAQPPRRLLEPLAEYGVPSGVCGDMAMDGTAWFWTLRGVAKAMPYELVTEKRFYGDPGIENHARIFYDRGYAKLVASTIAGNPVFNQWKERQ